MRVIICDRCKRIQGEEYLSITVEKMVFRMGELPEVNLCSGCSSDFFDWVREGKDDGDSAEDAR